MKERPILFSAQMVRAILDGRKTQTRRIVKPQVAVLTDDLARSLGVRPPSEVNQPVIPCPYGFVGDRLWVREEHYRFGHWEPVVGAKARTERGRQRWKFGADTDETLFDAPAVFRKGRHHKDSGTAAWHKRLARFMPRALSRISLDVAGVRVERLNDISESDAKAEGIEQIEDKRETQEPVRAWKTYRFKTAHPRRGETITREEHSIIGYFEPQKSYRSLWESINGAGSWAANPWVWVIEFRRIDSATR